MKRRSRVARPDSFAPMKLLTRGRARLVLYRRIFSRISAGRESRVFRWRVFRVAMTEDNDFLVLGALNGGCCSHSARGRLVAGVLRLPLTWILVSSIKRPRRRGRAMKASAQSYIGVCKNQPSDRKFQQRMGPLEGRYGDPLLGGRTAGNLWWRRPAFAARLPAASCLVAVKSKPRRR